MKRTHLAIVAFTSIAIASCGGASSPTTTTAAKPTAVGAVYFGDTKGNSWTLANDVALHAQESPSVVLSTSDNITDDSNAELTLEQMAAAGNKVVFATWPGYANAVLKVASKYPNTCFEVAGVPRIALAKIGSAFPTESSLPNNVGTYYPAIVEGRYLSGMAAGAATKSGKIGFIASFPNADSISGINAFTLGARAMNPEAVVQVTWTATKSDELLERQAAESLIAAGADVIAQSTHTIGPGLAAEANGVNWVGNNQDQQSTAPKGWLTAPTWDFTKFFAESIAAVARGKCPHSDYFGNIYDKVVALAPFGASVNAETQGRIAAKYNDMRGHAFVPFQGPIKAQDGSDMIPAGTRVESNDLQTMTTFVEGVVGSAQG